MKKIINAIRWAIALYLCFWMGWGLFMGLSFTGEVINLLIQNPHEMPEVLQAAWIWFAGVWPW